MSNAPVVEIDPAAFRRDPYPDLALMRAEAPIAFVPQLGATLLTRRDDIYVCEKNVAVFSSHQPQGLMNRLMGHNMMRKDGEAHLAERKAIFPTVSPKTVRDHWKQKFEAHADALLAALAPAGRADLVTEFAMPFSARCLKDITGLASMRWRDMDAWSQAMIDGIANYAGDAAVEARCNAATAGIDAAIDDMVPVLEKRPDSSLLSVMLAAGMPMESVRANIKLAISGGQNEPRDAISGTVWALLTHPAERALVEEGRATHMQVFDEYCRWIAPIGMSPRRIAIAHTHAGVAFAPEDRIFLMFSSANRDEAHFERADRFEVQRDTSKAIAFGAGPHFCAGAWASRAMVAEVALPKLFAALPGLGLAADAKVDIAGWAFRGVLNLPVEWEAG